MLLMIVCDGRAVDAEVPHRLSQIRRSLSSLDGEREPGENDQQANAGAGAQSPKREQTEGSEGGLRLSAKLGILLVTLHPTLELRLNLVKVSAEPERLQVVVLEDDTVLHSVVIHGPEKRVGYLGELREARVRASEVVVRRGCLLLRQWPCVCVCCCCCFGGFVWMFSKNK